MTYLREERVPDPTARQVEFDAGDGSVLRGLLWVPEAAREGGVPGVVMTHGFSATIPMGLVEYAETFVAAGLAVLAYDHRHLGASDGEPRQVVDPFTQIADQRRALTFLAAQPAVDAARLGVWGSSYSGGQVLVLGAVDDRVRAVVANVPFAGMPSVDYATASDDAFVALRDAVLADEEPAPDTSRVGPVTIVAEPGATSEQVYLSQPESAEWFLDRGGRAGSGWHNHVFLRRAFGHTPAFDPGLAVVHLQAPTLFVVATEDRVAATEVAVAAHERAPEPKQLVLIDGHHFTPYSGDALVLAAASARDWFLDHL
jgi:pimeloyl-ACP methyl ester carboxylesterase